MLDWTGSIEPNYRRIRYVSDYDGTPIIRNLAYSLPANISATNFTPTIMKPDSFGDIYILSKSYSNIAAGTYIVKLNVTTGAMTHIAGTGINFPSSSTGAATASSIGPIDFCLDKDNNVYICEAGGSIRVVDAATGNISTLSYVKNSSLDIPLQITIDRQGRLYYTETGSVGARKVVMLNPPYNVGPAQIIVQQTPPVVTPTTTTTLPTPVGPPTTTPPTSIQSIGLIQTADGRLFTKITTDTDQSLSDQAAVGYKTFFVSAVRSSQQRNSV